MTEECFPRGRPTVIPNSGVKKLKKVIDDEFSENVLFGEKRHNAKKEEDGQKRKRKSDNDGASKFLKEHGVKDKDALLNDEEVTGGRVDFLPTKRLQEGMLLLGCIREIHDLELIVSLPHCNTGFVQATNISSVYTSQIQRHLEAGEEVALVPLSDMFHIGQIVVCGVVSIMKTSVQLTLAPSAINKYLTTMSFFHGQIVVGAVKSEEDHGFMVDIGKSKVNAFLPSKEAAGEKLTIGTVIRCLVTDIKGEGSILLLSVDEKKLSKAFLKGDQSVSLDQLQPGMVGNFVPKHKMKIGVVGKFLDFDASVCALDGDMKNIFVPDTENDDFSRKRKKSKVKSLEKVELEEPEDVENEKKKFKGPVKSCVLYINPLSKHVSISTRPILFKKDAMQKSIDDSVHSFPRGQKCKVTVTKHIKGLGALMRVNGKANCIAFCPSKQLCDEKREDLHEKFRQGESFAARVLRNISVDGTLIVSLKKSVVESEFFDFDSIVAGSHFECYIKSVQDNGLFVTLGKKSSPIRGFIPKIHLADIMLHHPEKKFSEGDVITCKVLLVDYKIRRVTLTHKKTLIKSKLPTITGYDQLVPGVIAHGYIASIKKAGVHVNFYENVHGFVPNSELSSEFVENPEQLYYIGQVMKCRVLSCDTEAERARLSFILKPKDGTRAGSTILQSYDVEVVSKADDGVNVLTVGDSGRKTGFLSTMHLSDYPSLARAWHCLLNPGDMLKNCTVVTKKSPLQLTRKKSITQFDKDGDEDCGVGSFSELKEDACVPGFVRHVAEYGVFVQLRGGLVGLCPKSKMADRFLVTTEHYYQEGQSVMAKVIEIDKEKKRFIVSLRVTDSPLDSQDHRMRSYLEERKEIMEVTGVSWPDTFTTGCKVPVELSGENDDGSHVCTNASFGEFSAKLIDIPGDTETSGCMNATLLSVDLATKHIILSSDPDLLFVGKKADKSATMKATVKSVDEDVAAVVVVTGHNAFVALMPTRTHPNHPFYADLLPLAVDDEVDVTGSVLVNNISIVSAKVSSQSDFYEAQKNYSGRQRTESESSLRGDVNFGNLQVGQEVEGVIRSVRKSCLLVRFTESELEGGYRGNPVTGRLHVSELEENPQTGPLCLKKYRPWEKIKCTVIGFRDVRTQHFLAITSRNATRCVLELTLRELHNPPTVEELKVGQSVVAYSSQFCHKKQQVEVDVTPLVKGFIPLLLLGNDPQDALLMLRKAKTKTPIVWHCVVTKIFKASVSLAAKGAIIDRDSQADILYLKENCITNAKVLKVFATNLVLALPHGCSGKVHITDSSDMYEDQPFEKYDVGQFLRCAVISCPSNKSLILSLRASRFTPMDSVETDVKDEEISDRKRLKVGQVVRGYVTNSSNSGIFVALSRNVTGRVEIAKTSKYFIKDASLVEEIFKEGRVVQCKIIEISQMEGKIGLSLLESDTGCPDLVPESLELPLRHGKQRSLKRQAVGTLVDKVGKKKRKLMKTKKKGKKEKSGTVEDKDSGLDEDLQPDLILADSTTANLGKITPEEDPGFSWDAGTEETRKTTLDHDDTNSDNEEEDVPQEAPKKKSKMEKALELAREEAELRRKEEVAASDGMPQTAHDWDKLVLASPQNSMYWVSYMAFHLRSTEVEAARVVAERAIKTIDFREEQEKWNVWAALLNLENRFGSEESLQDTMDRARQHNDPLKVSIHMVSIFEKSGKFDRAQQLCEKMLRKFRRNKTVWMLYMTHLMQQGKRDEANVIMKRSLQSLEKSSHLDIISKFGQLEYKCGDPEQGRVIFENALSSYPKRSDIWSIYIDMLVKAGKIDEAREVYERVVTLNMSTKKMRTFFKRFVEFETKYGTDDSVAEVRQKALEFVESKTSQMME